MWQLADEFGVAALPALLEAVSGRCAEADAAATAGNSCWWCMREAAMMAVSACCDQVQAVSATYGFYIWQSVKVLVVSVQTLSNAIKLDCPAARPWGFKGGVVM